MKLGFRNRLNKNNAGANRTLNLLKRAAAFALAFLFSASVFSGIDFGIAAAAVTGDIAEYRWVSPGIVASNSKQAATLAQGSAKDGDPALAEFFTFGPNWHTAAGTSQALSGDGFNIASMAGTSTNGAGNTTSRYIEFTAPAPSILMAYVSNVQTGRDLVIGLADGSYTVTVPFADMVSFGKQFKAVFTLPQAGSYKLYPTQNTAFHMLRLFTHIPVLAAEANEAGTLAMGNITTDSNTNMVNVPFDAKFGFVTIDLNTSQNGGSANINNDVNYKIAQGFKQVTVSMYKGTEVNASALEDSETFSEAADSVTFAPEGDGDYTFQVTGVTLDGRTLSGAPKSYYFKQLISPPSQYIAMVEEGAAAGKSKITVTVPAINNVESYTVRIRENSGAWSQPYDFTVDKNLPAQKFMHFTAGATVPRAPLYVYAPDTEFAIGSTVYVEVTAHRTEYDPSVSVKSAPVTNIINAAGINTYATPGVATTEAAWNSGNWGIARFGPSSSTGSGTASVTGAVNNAPLPSGTIGISQRGGAGKLQQTGDDGMGFYYTSIPKGYNFELKTTVTVPSWTYNNAQEGFVVMARDCLPDYFSVAPTMGSDPTGHQVSSFSNSFGFIVSKIEYNFNTAEGIVSEAGSRKVSMRLGVGARTITNIFEKNEMPPTGSVEGLTETLESSCGMATGASQFNIVANNTVPASNILDAPMLMSSFDVTFKKTNTGFHILWVNPADRQTVEYIMYDWEQLFVIDKDFVHVGFGAARDMTIDVAVKSFTMTNAAADPAPAPRPTQYKELSVKVNSAANTGDPDYCFMFSANADGKLTISNDIDFKDIIVSNVAVTADKELRLDSKLIKPSTVFWIKFKPNADFQFNDYTFLTSYDEVGFSHSVNLKRYGQEGESIYVAPYPADDYNPKPSDGIATNKGTPESPLDIVTAFNFVRPGQTVVLMPGRYVMRSSITIPRGRNGSADKLIRVVAQPGAARPVLDFDKQFNGIMHWGNYWYFYGFDITRTRDMDKGITVCGSYNTLDRIQAYGNGNVGIGINGTSTETKDKWPSYNLILNCDAYNNWDPGATDSDGFSAKLTVGDGNVFKGCMAWNNADDGFDFFAKTDTGQIGSVTVDSCIAFNNGYRPGASLAEGKGNGFKLGGNNIPGGHRLINSLAFGNYGKGIDSNSCPDVYVRSSTSVDSRENRNIALYTNMGNTAYDAAGMVSWRTPLTTGGAEDQLKTLGKDKSKFDGATNFLWNVNGTGSVNSPLSGSATTIVSGDFMRTALANAPKGEPSAENQYNPFERRTDGTVYTGNYFELSDAAVERLTVNGIRPGYKFGTKSTSSLGAEYKSLSITQDNLGAPATPYDNASPYLSFTAEMVLTTIVGGKVKIDFVTSHGGTPEGGLIIDVKAEGADGNAAVASDYTFTPLKAGKYTVTVNVTAANGLESRITRTITVKPSVSWTPPVDIKAGKEVVVNPVITGGDSLTVEITVKLGGQEIAVADGKFTAATAGTYTVTITASDGAGSSQTETFEVTVAEGGGCGSCGSAATMSILAAATLALLLIKRRRV